MAGERGSAVVSAGTAVVMMLSMSMLFHCHVADAKPHTINSWTIQSNPNYYNNWAANEKKFKVGETLVFKFDSSTHNAVEVDEATYNSCNTAGKKTTSISSGIPVKLTKTGKRYFICSFTSHCGLGMKLKINVVS